MLRASVSPVQFSVGFFSSVNGDQARDRACWNAALIRIDLGWPSDSNICQGRCLRWRKPVGNLGPKGRVCRRTPVYGAGLLRAVCEIERVGHCYISPVAVQITPGTRLIWIGRIRANL